MTLCIHRYVQSHIVSLYNHKNVESDIVVNILLIQLTTNLAPIYKIAPINELDKTKYQKRELMTRVKATCQVLNTCIPTLDVLDVKRRRSTMFSEEHNHSWYVSFMNLLFETIPDI